MRSDEQAQAEATDHIDINGADRDDQPQPQLRKGLLIGAGILVFGVGLGAAAFAAATPPPRVVTIAIGPNGDNLARYLGDEGAIDAGEECGFPIHLGEGVRPTNRIDARQAREHLRVTDYFTSMVPITVVVQPGDVIQVAGADIICPAASAS